jgi:gliding motility-associated-like protein
MVEVFGSPKVGFTAQPDSVMPPSQPVHCYNNSDTGTYLWNFGDGTISAETEPIHFYQNVTGYFHISLTVISQNGCVDSLKLSDSVYVMPIGFVKFPDAFSPNNDGLNDVFKPVAAKSIKNYDLKIYNNWGMLVFTSGKPENGWDGKYQNTIVAPGVYMWILNGTYANGKPFTESGNVTVIFPQK